MKPATLFAVLLLCVGGISSVSAQTHLILVPSPQALGRGGLYTVMDGDDPMSPMMNPGMLGLLADRNNVAVGFYPKRTEFESRFSSGGESFSYYARSVNIGFSRRMIGKLFHNDGPRLSIGLSVHEVRFDYPLSSISDEYGNITGTYDSYDDARGFSIGAGLHWKYVQLGIGWTNRWVRSLWGIPKYEADWLTNDVGFVVQSSLTDLFWKPIPAGGTSFLHTFIKPSLSYALTNLGPSFSAGYNSREPQRRRDALTLALAVGCSVDLRDGEQIQVASVEVGECVGDNLVRPGYPDGGTYYNPLRDIQPFNDLVLGKYHHGILHSKGFEFSFGETVSVRFGSRENEREYERYNTSGWGIRAGGVMKIIASSQRIDAKGVVPFILRNIDLRYNSATREEDPGSSLDGTTYQQFVLLWKS